MPDQTHRQSRVRDIHTDLLAAEQGQKRRESCHEWHAASGCDPCGSSDHVLFRYTELNEQFRMLCSKAAQSIGVLQISSANGDLVTVGN
ncbi:hypothetical protein D3C85_1595200 [compost metagenome]